MSFLHKKNCELSAFWDKHAIKAEVHRRGKTLEALAREARLDPNACRVALHRHHAKGEQAISNFLGIPLSTLWPDRHKPLPKRLSHSSPEEHLAHSRNGELR